jgi:hypothetical protein
MGAVADSGDVETLLGVMAGLVAPGLDPGVIHALLATSSAGKTWMPAQASSRSLRKLGCKRGHDGEGMIRFRWERALTYAVPALRTRLLSLWEESRVGVARGRIALPQPPDPHSNPPHKGEGSRGGSPNRLAERRDSRRWFVDRYRKLRAERPYSLFQYMSSLFGRNKFPVPFAREPTVTH